MYIKSAYKEVNMSAHARPKFKRKIYRMNCGSGGRVKMSYGHNFSGSTIKKRREQVLCRYCEQPKFAVEMQRCTGRKRS